MTVSIPGYRILDGLYQSHTSTVYRAKRDADDLTVVIKILTEDYPSPRQIFRYQHEYEISHSLGELKGVIRALGFEKTETSCALVMEDIGADSLKVMMGREKFSVEEVLSLGVLIAQHLGEIHSANVIHKDLNPANIIYNPNTGELKIIDFGISSALTRESPSITCPEVLEGTLPYISPEQTGRMNQSVDYRTDFYSLGATLYEMLTGRPPFEAHDSLEMIHCHIAKPPVAPHYRNVEVPKPLSDIVMKLLAKTPDRRYKSAWGIKADLEECLGQFRATGDIVAFPIAQKDISDRLTIPQKLYGRKQETERLLSGFEQVTRSGGRAIVLISGHSGIGKTALVREIYKPMTLQRGYYISGKFDQFLRNMPYTALINAFQQLIRQLLAEPEESINAWKKRLLDALGISAQVIVDIIPDLELILGRQPAVDVLSPSESQNRFMLLFQKFFGVFARKDHPLVLFIDDLQWADPASIKLVSTLMTSPDDLCFYFLGAYRDNEVNPGHPLFLMLSEIAKIAAMVNEITLGPLAFEHVSELLCDTFYCTAEKAFDLTELILAKTIGNPFFINEFLEVLYAEELVKYRQDLGAWDWNLGKVRAREISDNVVELMGAKIQKLSGETQEALKLAACIGVQFDLEILSGYLKKSPKEAFQLIFPAIAAGLLIPLGEEYKWLELATPLQGQGQGGPILFKYSHDRIKHAAYSLLSDAQRTEIHRKLGLSLLQRNPPEQDDHALFDIVSHLNLALSLLETADDKRQLAQLNAMAGKKAKESAAHDSAMRCLHIALDLLGPTGWEQDYELTVTVHQEAAESACLSGDLAGMSRLTEVLLNKTRTLLEKVRAYEIRIEAFIGEHRVPEAVQTGLAVLRLLGLKLPERAGTHHALLGLVKTKIRLLGKRIEDLVDLPEMTDPVKLAQIRIMRCIATAVYYADPKLMPVMLFAQVNTLLKYGNCSLSPSVFGSWGIVLSGALHDYRTAHEVGKVAIRLLDRWPSTKHRCRTMFLVNTFVKHWNEHLRNTLHDFQESYQIGMLAGDLEYAALSAHQYGHHSFYLGRDLVQLEQELIRYSEAIRQLRQGIPLTLNSIFHQSTLNLLGRSSDPCLLVGTAFDEQKMLPILQESKEGTAIFAVYYHKMMLCTFFRRYREVLELLAVGLPYIDAIRGFFAISRVAFMHALAGLQLYEEASAAERKQFLKVAGQSLSKLKTWSRFAPMNHHHLYCLLKAELCRVRGKDIKAVEWYEQAVDEARKNEYLQEEALASELMADFYISRAKTNVGKAFLGDARFAYLKWGAAAKIKEMEERHGQFMPRAGLPTTLSTSTVQSISVQTTTSKRTTNPLDMESVLKATQNISGEIVLDVLMDKLMKVVIENAGAEKGFLILRKDDSLTIEAQIDLERSNDTIVASVSIDQCEGLSNSIARYVSRTKEKVVLGDAANEGSFVQDPYVVANRPKSVLCIPIQRHGELVAILYLENNQATDAFTPIRVEVLTVLSVQAAISIDNARLYSKLEKALVEAKESARVKSEFLARTSHELRTPLNSIINLPEGLLTLFHSQNVAICSTCQEIFELESGETVNAASVCPACSADGSLALQKRWSFDGELGELPRHLENVVTSGRHLLKVVDDILDISKLEAGKMVVRPEEIKLQDVFRDIYAQASPLSAQKGIPLTVPTVSLTEVLVADRVKLVQIFLNLIGNALKFSDEGSPVDLTVELTPDKVVICVRDKGIGIPKHEQKKIFDSFHQAEAGATRKYGGTGLGLTITKQLVELHGGRLWVESVEGKGSDFFVELPKRGMMMTLSHVGTGKSANAFDKSETEGART